MNVRVVSVVAVIAVAFFLSACGTTNLGKYQGTDAGYAVLTFASEKDAPYRSYRFSVRSRDRKLSGNLVWLKDNMFSNDRPDFDYGSQAGFVSVLRLQPGDYEMYDFEAYQGGYPVEVTWRADKEFSIPFTVHAGEAVYLGEYLAIATKGKNVFGITVQGPPYFVVSDQHARDLPYARTRQPAIAAFTPAVPNPDGLGLAYLRSKPLP